MVQLIGKEVVQLLDDLTNIQVVVVLDRHPGGFPLSRRRACPSNLLSALCALLSGLNGSLQPLLGGLAGGLRPLLGPSLGGSCVSGGYMRRREHKRLYDGRVLTALEVGAVGMGRGDHLLNL